MWPYIVTNFFVTKPTRCTNFTNLFCRETLHVSESSSVCLSSGICSLYTQQLYISYRFVGSFRARPGWNCRSILALLECCLGKLVHLVGFITKNKDSLFLQITNKRPFLNQKFVCKEKPTLPVCDVCRPPGSPILQFFPLLLMFSLQVAKSPSYLKNASRSGKTQGHRKTLKF